MVKAIIALIIASSFLLNAQTKEELKKLYDENRIEEAIQIAGKVAQNNPQDLRAQLLAGDVFYANENWEKALKYYQFAEEIEDDEPEVLVKLGRALHRTGNKEDAFEAFEDARDEDDEYMPVYLEFAEAYIRDGDIGEAQKWVDRGKDVDDKDARLYLTSGNMYYQQRVYELAKNDYLQALSLDSTNTEARFRLANSYRWLANRELDEELSNELFKKALIEWKRVINEDPNNLKALLESGKILFWAGRDKDAAPILNRYVNLKPDNKQARWYLAQSLNKLGRCDSAAKHLKWSAENIDSVRIKAKMLLAECYMSNKDYEDAVMTFQEVRKDTTFGLKEWKMLGAAAISIGDTSQAVEAWDTSIEMKPDANCGVMLALGKLFFVKKEYEKAEKYFKKKLATEGCSDKTNVDALRFSALGYVNRANQEGVEEAQKQEWLKKAQGLIEKALADYGDNAYLNLTLGDIFSGEGMNDKALAKYQEVIDNSDPENDKSILKAAYAKVAGIHYEKKSWGKLAKHSIGWSEFDPTSTTAPLYAAISYQNLYIGSEEDQFLQNACKWYKKLAELDPGNKYAANFLDQGYCDE